MVSIFKSYHPAIIFLLLVYTFLFRAIFFVEQISIPLNVSYSYAAQLVFNVLDLIGAGNYRMSFLIATALVFFQALYYNFLINHYRILSKSSYLPAMSYILISSLFNEFIMLTPALISLTFLIFALSKLLSTYKKEKVMAIIFDSSFLIAIASIIYFPNLIFYLFIIASLIVIRPVNLREYIISIIGLLVPYYFIMVYFFWNNRLSDFLETISITGLRFSFDQIKLSPQVISISIVVLIVVLWSLFFIQSNIFKMVVQVRSYLMVFIIMFIAGVLSMLIEFDGGFDHFVWIVPAVALAFSIFFLEMRRKWISEVVHLFLILTILFYQYSFLLK